MAKEANGILGHIRTSRSREVILPPYSVLVTQTWSAGFRALWKKYKDILKQFQDRTKEMIKGQEYPSEEVRLREL